jgi:cytochrome c biogenesis protein CcmG, thiol:disulfide interchange protein DsbE
MKQSLAKVKGVLFLLGGLAVGVLLGISVFYSGPNLAEANRQRSLPPSVGAPAPDFELVTVAGEKTRLSELKDLSVVIIFWATWCQPCREEMPLFQKYAGEKAGRLVFLGVNVEEDPAVVERFSNELGVSFPILLDRDGRVARSYYVRSYPATFFVDSKGVIRAQHLGQLDEKLLASYLETIGIKQ